MKKLFNALTPKKFTLISIALSLLGDVLIFSYIHHKFTHGFSLFKKLMKMAFEQNGLDFSQASQNFLNEQFAFFCLMLITFIAILMMFHIIIYVLYYFRKKFSHFYLTIYSCVAIPGCGFMMLSTIWGDPLMGILFGLQSFSYLFIFMGLRHFNFKK